MLSSVRTSTGASASLSCTSLVTLGGTNAEVVYAGANSTLVGLDQTNILIPRSLIGRGLLDVVFRTGLYTANTVQVQVK